MLGPWGSCQGDTTQQQYPLQQQCTRVPIISDNTCNFSVSRLLQLDRNTSTVVNNPSQCNNADGYVTSQQVESDRSEEGKNFLFFNYGLFTCLFFMLPINKADFLIIVYFLKNF
jgi:hypothetical protein